jgi:glycosyltransferase involved in cell wall biosynthesis
VGEHMLGLAAMLRLEGLVSFVCPPSPTGLRFLDRAARLGLDTLALDWGQPRASERFCEWLHSRQVDICHVHAGIIWEGLDVVTAARMSGVSGVLRTEHLPYMGLDESGRGHYASALRHVDKVICVSREARDSFVDAGVPANLVTFVRNSTPACSAECDRDQVRASLGLDAQMRIVLTVARYTEQKDHRTLLAAAPAILAREPRARFVFVGTGPLEEAVRRTIHERNLDQHVILLGHRADVPDLMAAADLFVLPSRFEGLPLAVLEAMAAGLPVVATRVCGTAEAVEDRVTGLLVEPGDAEILASAISELLAKPRWAARLGARGRVRVQQAFSLDRMAREILALYHDLLTRSRRPHRSEVDGFPFLVQAAGVTL